MKNIFMLLLISLITIISCNTEDINKKENKMNLKDSVLLYHPNTIIYNDNIYENLNVYYKYIDSNILGYNAENELGELIFVFNYDAEINYSDTINTNTNNELELRFIFTNNNIKIDLFGEAEFKNYDYNNPYFYIEAENGTDKFIINYQN